MDVSNQTLSRTAWEMSFQESGPVMKPTRVIKMQDGHGRPPRGFQPGWREESYIFVFFCSQKKWHCTSQETEMLAWYCLINPMTHSGMRQKEPAGPGRLVVGLWRGRVSSHHLLCARPYTSCSVFRILLYLHKIQCGKQCFYFAGEDTKTQKLETFV